MRQTLENLKKQAPKFWLTKDLDVFLQTQKQGSEIDQTEYEKWILKVKVMYLLTQELDVSKLNLPMTTSPTFTQECIKELNSIAPSSSILNILTANKMKVKVEKQIAKLPPQDPILSWFINLKLASRGEKNERSFFEKLFSLKNDEILQDIVVLSSVNFMTDVTSQMHQEFDMLIFSWSRKLIIGVEVKRTLTSKTTAFKQLNKYHSALEKQLGDQLGPGWSFHPVICVEKNTINFSNHHFIDLSTDLRTWLSNVLNNRSACLYQLPHLHPLEQLKKVLQLIVFSIHMSTKDQPRPITTTHLFEYVRNAIDSLSNTHNIVFYSKQQLPVISSKDPCYNKVIFMAGFGTGKTFLLFEKAIILSKNDTFRDRILYVICNGEGLLYHDRKAHLEEKGITVITGKSAIESLKMPWIRQHFKAIFFDEWNEDVQQKIDVKWLDDLPVCWIAPNSAYRAKSKELSLLKIHFKGFEIIHLTCNLRNTKEIVKKTKSIAETQLYEYAHGVSETPVNFLIGSPAVHVSSFGEAIFEERLLPKPKEGFLLVSDSVNFPVPPNEQVKFFHSSRNDFNNDENPCDFLRQGNVLVVSRNYVSGFESPVVVYENAEMLEEDLEHHECNISMRCTTKLYVVGQNSDLNGTTPYVEIVSLLQSYLEDSQLLSRFKICASNYFLDHVKHFERRDIFTHILPVLKETVANLSDVGDQQNFSAEPIVNVLSPFLSVVSSLLMTERLSNEHIRDLLRMDWFIQRTIELDLHHCTTVQQFQDTFERTLKFQSLLRTFDECAFGKLNRYTLLKQPLLKLSIDFDISKLSNMLKGKTPLFEINFWIKFDSNILSELFLPHLGRLHLSEEDNAFTKMFKVYSGIFIRDHCMYYNESSEWFKEVQPILEGTLKQISSSSVTTLSKLEIIPSLRGYLKLIISDVMKREDARKVTSKEFIDEIIDDSSITDKRFLEFHWIHRFIKYPKEVRVTCV